MLASPMVPMLLSALMAILFNCRDVHGEEWQSEKCLSDVDVETIGGEHNEAPRGQEILGPGLGEFIFIEGGEFTMGRNDGEHENQRPEHVVELSSFYVGRTPVTNAQFVEFLNEANVPPDEYLYSQMTRRKPSVTFEDGRWSSVEGTENDAAGGLNWELGEGYCHWLSAKSGRTCRLPTEAEWEYVCRGKEGRKFPWGDDQSDLRNRVWLWRSWSRSMPTKIPVGAFSKGATPEGVFDMIGYMDEMCSDWYDPEYYVKSPRKNPQGPSEPVQLEHDRIAKVTRGGLAHYYSTEGSLGFFRVSEFFGVLPNQFLPRGWSRDRVNQRAAPFKSPDAVYGRLGLRIVVELTDPNRPEDENGGEQLQQRSGASRSDEVK